MSFARISRNIQSDQPLPPNKTALFSFFVPLVKELPQDRGHRVEGLPTSNLVCALNFRCARFSPSSTRRPSSNYAYTYYSSTFPGITFEQ